MPRYFFHTVDGARSRDTTGTDLSGLVTARTEAVKYVGAVMQQQPDMLEHGGDFRVEVTDRDDMLLFTVVVLAMSAPATGEV